MKQIVLIAGFEFFYTNLYRQAAKIACTHCEELEVIIV